jgi:hypothetical protein
MALPLGSLPATIRPRTSRCALIPASSAPDDEPVPATLTEIAERHWRQALGHYQFIRAHLEHNAPLTGGSHEKPACRYGPHSDG